MSVSQPLTPSFLEGVQLALNALEGFLLVMDSPRCELQGALLTGPLHDLRTTLLSRKLLDDTAVQTRIFPSLWSGVDDTMAGIERVKRRLQGLRERYPHAPLVLGYGLLSSIMHTDLKGLVAELSQDGDPAPMLVIPPFSVDADWMDGYQTFLRLTAPCFVSPLRAPLAAESDGRPTVAVFGHLHYRNEGDGAGNIQEVNSLLDALGLRSVGWLGAGSAAPLPPALDSVDFVVCFNALPANVAARLDPNRVLNLPLPIGLSGTGAFIEQLGRDTGRGVQAEWLRERALSRVIPLIEPLVSRHLRGRGALVLGPPAEAAAIAEFLSELGLQVPGALVLKRTVAADPALGRLRELGPRLIIDPTLTQAEDLVHELAGTGKLDLIVGPGLLHEVAQQRRLGYVESGYPSFTYHALRPAPIYGYEGVLNVAQRVYEAIMLREWVLGEAARPNQPEEVARTRAGSPLTL